MQGGLKVKNLKKYRDQNKRLISIITVVLNSEQFIEGTIRSVLDQSYDNIEFIIIDGNSTDNTQNIIKKYENQIDYWISEPDNGIYDAMNKGLELATGDYVNFLNAGDRFYNNDTLAILFHDVNSVDIDLVYGDTIVQTEKGNKLGYLKAFDYNKKNLIRMGTRTVSHQSLFIKKNKTPFYDSKYQLKGELDWYFEILESNKDLKIFYKNIPVVYYSLGGFGYNNFYKNLYERIVLIYNRFGLIRSIYNIPIYFISIIFHYVTILKERLRDKKN
ncbi:MAG: glycosyltransferase family 2 protein [Spirochaetota bacterium]|nr:glycosyltransferase family 2 protein [Spirochaetota bacterium]